MGRATIKQLLNRLLRHRDGSVSVISAVAFPVLIAVTGLVAEYGNGLMHKVEDQRVADAAAFAAATAYATDNTVSLTSMADAVAGLNGLDGSTVSASLITSPSGDGAKAVQVNVSTAAPLLLSRILGDASTALNVTAMSYAEITGGDVCVLALDPSSSGKPAQITGGTATLNDCSLQANSSSATAFNATGGTLTAKSVSTVGQISQSGGVVDATLFQHAAAIPDPYSGLYATNSVSSAGWGVPRRSFAMPHYVGLDVSKAITSICIVNEDGETVREGAVETNPKAIIGFLRAEGRRYGRVGLEAMSMASWLYEGLARAGLPVICIETCGHRRGIAGFDSVSVQLVDEAGGDLRTLERPLYVERSLELTHLVQSPPDIQGEGLQLPGEPVPSQFQRPQAVGDKLAVHRPGLDGQRLEPPLEWLGASGVAPTGRLRVVGVAAVRLRGNALGDCNPQAPVPRFQASPRADWTRVGNVSAADSAAKLDLAA